VIANSRILVPANIAICVVVVSALLLLFVVVVDLLAAACCMICIHSSHTCVFPCSLHFVSVSFAVWRSCCDGEWRSVCRREGSEDILCVVCCVLGVGRMRL